jgi:hypothetical protein
MPQWGTRSYNIFRAQFRALTKIARIDDKLGKLIAQRDHKTAEQKQRERLTALLEQKKLTLDCMYNCHLSPEIPDEAFLGISWYVGLAMIDLALPGALAKLEQLRRNIREVQGRLEKSERTPAFEAVRSVESSLGVLIALQDTYESM